MSSCAVPFAAARTQRRLRWFISTMDLKRRWSAFCGTMWCGSMRSLSPPVAARERGFESCTARMLISLDKIERRLGGALHQQLRQSVANALQRQEEYEM